MQRYKIDSCIAKICPNFSKIEILFLIIKCIVCELQSYRHRFRGNLILSKKKKKNAYNSTALEMSTVSAIH